MFKSWNPETWATPYMANLDAAERAGACDLVKYLQNIGLSELLATAAVAKWRICR